MSTQAVNASDAFAECIENPCIAEVISLPPIGAILETQSTTMNCMQVGETQLLEKCLYGVVVLKPELLEICMHGVVDLKPELEICMHGVVDLKLEVKQVALQVATLMAADPRFLKLIARRILLIQVCFALNSQAPPPQS
jgi:hypothetical protein